MYVLMENEEPTFFCRLLFSNFMWKFRRGAVQKHEGREMAWHALDDGLELVNWHNNHLSTSALSYLGKK